MYSKIKALC